MALNMPNAQSIMRHIYPNGLTLLIYETPHTQSVVITGTLDAGALYETTQGMASMTAAMLMRGTHQRDFDTLHDTLESSGADLGYSAGHHKVGFSGKALAEDLPLMIELLADTLQNPAFDIDLLEQLRGERLTSLNYLQQDTAFQASKAFREALYPVDHSYHYSTRGTQETITTLDRDQLAAFHARVYGSQRMILTIVGAVKTADVIQIVGDRLGGWHNVVQPARADLPPLTHNHSPQNPITVTVPGKQQTDFLFGAIGPSRYATDYQAANLGNSILGVFGMMGRIGQVVREREGLAYYAGSRVNGGHGPGAWRVSAGVAPTNVGRAVEIIKHEIDDFTQSPVSEEELDDNKSYFVGRLPLQLENNDGIAATIHAMESYSLGLDYLENYRSTIYNITAEDILNAARHYFKPENMILSIAGP
jgi:zinc protease